MTFQFRAHDLRRTAASYIGEAGADRFHIAQVLNHRSVTHSTATAIYDRYRYDKEKRAALEKWAEVLSGIVDVKPAPTIGPARPARRQNVDEFTPEAVRRAGDRAREEVGCAPTQSTKDPCGLLCSLISCWFSPDLLLHRQGVGEQPL